MNPTYTEKQIYGAALQIAAEAMGGIPQHIADQLTRSQSDGLMADLREAARASLMFSLMNYIADDDDA